LGALGFSWECFWIFCFWFKKMYIYGYKVELSFLNIKIPNHDIYNLIEKWFCLLFVLSLTL
jgi:hypothetical protein